MAEFKILFIVQMAIAAALFLIGAVKAIRIIMGTISSIREIEKEKKIFLESLERRQ